MERYLALRLFGVNRDSGLAILPFAVKTSRVWRRDSGGSIEEKTPKHHPLAERGAARFDARGAGVRAGVPNLPVLL